MSARKKPVLAWHFLSGDTLRDGTKAPKDGEWLEYTGPIKMCESGLHASRNPFDRAVLPTPTTAGIAKLLYPNQDIRQQDFAKFEMPDNFYDAAIGNPPFADIVIKATKVL